MRPDYLDGAADAQRDLDATATDQYRQNGLADARDILAEQRATSRYPVEDGLLWAMTGLTRADVDLWRDSEWLERRGLVSEAQDVRAYLRERRGR